MMSFESNTYQETEEDKYIDIIPDYDITDSYQEKLDKENVPTSENPIKISFEDINFDTTFVTQDEVDVFFEEYGPHNRFAINKYRMEKNKSTNIVTRRTFICEFGGKFKPKSEKQRIYSNKKNSMSLAY